MKARKVGGGQGMYLCSTTFGHLIRAIVGHCLYVGAVCRVSYHVYMTLGSDKSQRIFKKGPDVPMPHLCAHLGDSYLCLWDPKVEGKGRRNTRFVCPEAW